MKKYEIASGTMSPRNDRRRGLAPRNDIIDDCLFVIANEVKQSLIFCIKMIFDVKNIE